MMNARSIAWRSQCPTCGAAPGDPCTGKRGVRRAVHRDRYSRETQMERGERVEQFIKECAAHKALRFEEECDLVISRCESPIECLLMTALLAERDLTPFTSLFFCNGDMRDEPSFDEAAFFYVQQKFGPYRVDIAVWDASLPFQIAKPRVMIIECDGHEYHERTKDQARRDKQRDRYFQSRGHKVLRFTGSEIWADPSACAQEIINEFARDDDWRASHE